MAININSSGGGQGGGILGSKAGKVGLGFATGGLTGGIEALLSSGNPQLGALASIGGQIAAPGSEGVPEIGVDKEGIGSQFNEDPMSRRIASLTDNDHGKIFDDGMDALHEANLPADVSHPIAASILAAKHYGMKGYQAPDHIFGGLGIGGDSGNSN